MATSSVDASATDAQVTAVDFPSRAVASGMDGGDSAEMDLTSPSRRRSIARLVLLWTAIAVVMIAFAALRVVDLESARAPGTRWWMIWLAAAHAGVWVTAWFYLAFHMSERFPIGRVRLVRHVGAHLGGVVVLSAVATLEMAWYVDVTPLLDPGLPAPGWKQFRDPLIYYPLLAALAHAVVYAKRYWHMHATAERLRVDLDEAGRRRSAAELRALKAEINPHFLGSAVHAVASSVRTDPAAAERVLAELGDLVRVTMTRAHKQEVTLREELQTLEPFLDVERARLGRRFEVELEVEDDALDALIPDMVLQPMVENAARRGLACYEGGHIRISVRRCSGGRDDLELRVEPRGTGSWTAPPVPRAPATAAAWVANARSRLGELYGTRAALDVAGPSAATASSGATCLTVPWHDAEVESTRDAVPTVMVPREPALSAGVARVSMIRRLRIVPIVSMLVLSILFTIQHLERPVADGSTLPVPYRHAIPAGIIAAGIMVAIGLTAFHLARRYPPRWGSGAGTPWARAMLAHAKAAVVLGAVGSVLRFVNSWMAGYLLASGFRVVKFVTAAVGTIAFYVIIYILLAVVAFGIEYARRYRGTRTVARALSDQLAEAGRQRAAAELCALKAQLNPHFLGNALHTVSTLVRTNPGGAQRVLQQLGDLLRSAATRARTPEVTLREELETLEPYLAVEQVRLGQRLGVRWDVDEDLLEAQVPHMILQPLVENAVKHGLTPRRTEGHIEVRARRHEDRLEVSVRDDGVGLETDGGPRTGSGMGLSNTRARLAELYGGTATLELTRCADGGTVARLSLPWRDAPRTPRAIGHAPVSIGS